jgi:hypothetical protein
MEGDDFHQKFTRQITKTVGCHGRLSQKPMNGKIHEALDNFEAHLTPSSTSQASDLSAEIQS